MVGWYIGEVIVLVGVAPVLVVLLQRLLRPALAISATADQLEQSFNGIQSQLQAVPKLVQTRELTGSAYRLVGRYGAAIVAILNG